MRRGKYHKYKLILLEYLVKNNFIVNIDATSLELTQLASQLGIPMSSWYDITKVLERSNFIIMRRKNRLVGGIIVFMVYEIQLTKEGLEFLTRFRHA